MQPQHSESFSYCCYTIRYNLKYTVFTKDCIGMYIISLHIVAYRTHNQT